MESATPSDTWIRNDRTHADTSRLMLMSHMNRRKNRYG